ncbi:NAD(P)/FAD-dependent oxidoreductase, partial [Rhodococcus sp. NPDC058514]
GLFSLLNSEKKTIYTTASTPGSRTVAALATETRATTGCGGCSSVVQGICEWLRNSDPEPIDQPVHETPSIEEEGAA